jgi:Rrf2 family protein
MSQIIKISEAAALAFHTMVLMAAEPQRLFTTHQVASIFSISENHLSKVLQRLAHAGLVSTLRGPAGGYRLLKSPDEIRLVHIYEAIEGPLNPALCLLSEKRSCGSSCLLGDLLVEVDGRVRDYFQKTRLSDLSELFRSKIEGLQQRFPEQKKKKNKPDGK